MNREERSAISVSNSRMLSRRSAEGAEGSTRDILAEYTDPAGKASDPRRGESRKDGNAPVYRIEVYFLGMAIQGFASPKVERYFREGRRPRGAGWVAVAGVVARKLDMLDYAAALSDLASPPGNRLEALRGDLTGFHSVRINDQWRIVFRWMPSGPIEVDVRDYH